MADGKRYGVSCVIRFRRLWQLADSFHHVHDLAFLCAAIADDCLLDLQRRILIYFYTVLAAGQQNVMLVLKNSSSIDTASGLKRSKRLIMSS